MMPFTRQGGVLVLLGAAFAMGATAHAQTTSTRTVTNTATFGPNSNIRIGPGVLVNRYGSTGSPYGNPYTPTPVSPYSGYGYSPSGSSSGGCYGSGYGNGGGTNGGYSVGSSNYSGGSYGTSGGASGYSVGSGNYPGGSYGASGGAGGYSGGYSGAYGGSCGDPYNGYLTGAAAVISSQASFLVSKRQADVLHEQARSAAVDVRRKIYEEWKYERNDQPTLEQIRRESWEQAYQRAIFHPPLGDIWSADALNRIFDHASRIQGRGVAGLTIPLDDETVKHINFSTGVAGNVGALKDKGKLHWPSVLERKEFGTERNLFTHLAADAVRQGAMNNKVDTGTTESMETNLAALNEKLAERIRDITPDAYVGAKHYLMELDQALRVLKRPDVAKFLNNEYAARSKTVGELLQDMSSLGLRFAPAVSGNEAAYNSLYRGLVAYDLDLARKAASQE
jgi:hypothetical protein